MKSKRLVLVAFAAAFFLAACDFKQQADARFADQHFKTTIALVELHKLRNGHYPASLEELQFAGDWDAIALGSVEYRLLDTGYELNVRRGWVGSPPALRYPPEFWNGLGLVRSNMKADAGQGPAIR